MKIRTDFVTNSSSSSFVTMNITSPKLAALMKQYEKFFTQFGNSLTINGDDISLYLDEAYANVPDSKHKMICGIVNLLNGGDCCYDACSCCREEEYCASGDTECGHHCEECEYDCLCSGFYGDSTDEMVEFVQTLKSDMKGYNDDIQHFEMEVGDVGWGGDSDSRYYPENYDEETLEELYGFIAEEKGCEVEDVTEEDFCEYVAGETSISTTGYIYDRKTDKEESYSGMELA